MLSKQVIYNKIKQCLISILSDLCHREACEIMNAEECRIIICCSKFIMSCRTQGPMKMQKNQLTKPGNQWKAGKCVEGGIL